MKGAVREGAKAGPRTLLRHVVAMKAPALARMWVDFNRWKWPRDLPERFKPRWWDGTVVPAPETRARQFGFMEAFMAHAAATVDEDAIRRQWQKDTASVATPPTAKPETKVTRKARTPDTGSEEK